MPNTFLEAFIKALASFDVDLQIEIDDDKKTCDVISDIAKMFDDTSACEDDDDADEIEEATKMMDELECAAQPIVAWLAKYGHPYMNVIVTQDGIRVSEDTMGIPFECDGDE